MNKRVFDDSFKTMAVALTHAKGSVKEVADELGVDPNRLNKWRRLQAAPKERASAELNEEQRSIKRLQKELKEAQMNVKS